MKNSDDFTGVKYGAAARKANPGKTGNKMFSAPQAAGFGLTLGTMKAALYLFYLLHALGL
jgi:hypothetical protein